VTALGECQMDTLAVEKGWGIVTVRLDRPPVNAVNRIMRLELRETFEAISADRDVRVAILAATGTRTFCGGVDLKESRVPDPDTDPIRALLDPGWEWRAAQAAIRECAVPVIAAIEGPALGAGFGLAAMCDILIAGPGATFGLPELKVGVLGGASKALHMLGPYRARTMFFTGEPIGAEEMHRLGIVAELVSAGQAEDRAREIAADLAQRSPVAVRLAKESLLRVEGDAVQQSYRIEQDYTARLAAFEDSAEARQAFLEKRPPRWSWRRRPLPPYSKAAGGSPAHFPDRSE
jgi:enoyl-CoA hydratase